MGMRKKYTDYIEKHAVNIIGDLNGKHMLELGDQELKGMKKITLAKTGKEYYESKGVIHTSIDLNGRRGALRFDLSQPIDMPRWIKHFDIITNLGTTEHVEPQSSQYECFKNIHNFLKVGGIVIHVVPDIEARRKHNFNTKHANNYYAESFFEMLTCKGLAYDLIDLTRSKYNFLVCLKKVSNLQFIENREMFDCHLIRGKGGKIWKGINDRV